MSSGKIGYNISISLKQLVVLRLKSASKHQNTFMNFAEEKPSFNAIEFDIRIVLLPSIKTLSPQLLAPICHFFVELLISCSLLPYFLHLYDLSHPSYVYEPGLNASYTTVGLLVEDPLV